MAVVWLRRYRCGVVLSEQACVSGEMPDAIGWKRANHSVLIECKISRADFLAAATDGAEGAWPAHLNYAFKDGGFYAFRSDWSPGATWKDTPSTTRRPR